MNSSQPGLQTNENESIKLKNMMTDHFCWCNKYSNSTSLFLTVSIITVQLVCIRYINYCPMDGRQEERGE
jgi:hypothetical protein